MSELQTIQSALERVTRHRRWAEALRGLWLGLLIGAVISLLIVAVYHVIPLPLWALLLAALAPLPGMLAGLLIGGWHKPALAEMARWVDSQQHLQERLGTALEVANRQETGVWRDLVLVDAASHVKELDPRRLMPLRLPRTGRWALLVLALVAGLGFVPEYRSKAALEKKAEQARIQQTGQQLAELTKHNLEKRPPALEPTRKSLESVANLGEQLAKQTLTRSEALHDLANSADKLKEQLKELGQDPALRRLEQTARSASGGDTQSAAGLQKQIESLQKQLGSPVNTPDALEKLQKSLEKLQEAAKGMAGENSPGAAESQKQQLSQSLSSLSKQVQDMGLQLPQLDEAINALAANQTDLFLKDLQASMNDLDKMRNMAKTLQQLQQQAEKIGKDLAEQLKNGQPEAAQQTLQKMMSQLNTANLSPEQLQKMMNEVAKALSPAGNYGKVAEHLKDALNQMKGANQPAASKSLAAASKELGDLMQQLGDAQSLQATLDALNEASMAIGSGQGWRAGMGTRPGPPRAGRGGRPGGGVGTWADDEEGGWDGQSTAGWDNSSVQRPDSDPRGHTDRGPGELTEALQPTKVKGQFTPGGPMPSITLKGVSIKGQSKVNYEEAATAAQSEAQSALSHDQVPRAYQGAVREYFDDLKK